MINTIATVLGGIVLVLGLGSKWLEKCPLPPTLLALLTGILLGPQIFGVIDPAALGEKSFIMEKAARLTLGIGRISVALRVPKEYPRQKWRELLILIGFGFLYFIYTCKKSCLLTLHESVKIRSVNFFPCLSEIQLCCPYGCCPYDCCPYDAQGS